MTEPTTRWRVCVECDSQGYILARTGESMCSGLGGPYEPVEEERDCEGPGCVGGYVAVEEGDPGYENAYEERPCG